MRNTLFSQLRGSGPVLLLIPGGPTDADVFSGLSDALADRYSVLTYDPRGNSRSAFPDGAEEDMTVPLHADDAHELLASRTSEPAFVFGNSSGALIGLDLAARYPDQVSTLVAHEPPSATLLPDYAQQQAHGRDVYETYKTQGVGPAMMKFVVGAGMAQGAPPPSPPPGPAMERMGRNVEFFLAHQFLAFGEFVPDVECLKHGPVKVVVAIGAASRGQLAHRCGVALASALGQTPVEMPGDHGGFMADPRNFGEQLHQLLAS